jgi:isocitrate dehydrogenase kinase/phosphatase
MADEPTGTTPPAFDYAGILGRVSHRSARIMLAARLSLTAFDQFYASSRAVPGQAKAAFEARDVATSVALSQRRLAYYAEAIAELASLLRQALPALRSDPGLWSQIEETYMSLVAGRYEDDLATAFIHSTRRVMYADEWTPVAYSFGRAAHGAGPVREILVSRTPGRRRLATIIAEILKSAGFKAPFRDLPGEAAEAADRIAAALAASHARLERIEMVDGLFFRNRGAYLVGRLHVAAGPARPLALALENSRDGIFIDAVLMREADLHNIFSSTLANFHVTQPRYHELCVFLHEIMPGRPLGLHYSTIGYNHLGKVAIMAELAREIGGDDYRFETAVGFRGSVAMGFSAPSSAYVLKVIRDHPTAAYKWGVFPGIAAVIAKYRRVHEINRTGSMLDNMVFARIDLDAAWFDPDLLAELAMAAAETVAVAGEKVNFRHLIVQPKMVPLPVYLEAASAPDRLAAIDNLGHCIKNNAAAGIFNRDLDARNYGVSRYGKVYLFDYDAIEPLADVKVRTNLGRIEGEEDIPDWFFETGTVFLPEELESGLMIEDRDLRRFFRRQHGDLFATGYWLGMQRALARGWVPRLEVYPQTARLSPGAR